MENVDKADQPITVVPSPYHLGTLAEGAKECGLEATEELIAKFFVNKLLPWFELSAKASPTPVDDFALVLVPTARKAVLSQVDKIDGEDDGLAGA